MKTLKEMIDLMHYSVISDLDFNVSKKEIKFSLMLEDNGEKTYHILQFINVTSFLWVEHLKESQAYDYAECEYYELTSIVLKRTAVSSEGEWLKQYPLEYNVAIEIWETALLINATEVFIDGQHYRIS